MPVVATNGQSVLLPGREYVPAAPLPVRRVAQSYKTLVDVSTAPKQEIKREIQRDMKKEVKKLVKKETGLTTEAQSDWFTKLKSMGGKLWDSFVKEGWQQVVTLGAAFLDNPQFAHLRSVAAEGLIPAGTIISVTPISPDTFGDSTNIEKAASMYTYYEFVRSYFEIEGLTDSVSSTGAIAAFICPDPGEYLATTNPNLVRQAVEDYHGVIVRPNQKKRLNVPRPQDLLYTNEEQDTDPKFVQQGSLYLVAFTDLNLNEITYNVSLKYHLGLAKSADSAIQPAVTDRTSGVAYVSYINSQGDSDYGNNYVGDWFTTLTTDEQVFIPPAHSYARDNYFSWTDPGDDSTKIVDRARSFVYGFDGDWGTKAVRYFAYAMVDHVDGSTKYPVAGGQNGIAFPAGTHRVSFTYNPTFANATFQQQNGVNPITFGSWYIATGIDIFDGPQVSTFVKPMLSRASVQTYGPDATSAMVPGVTPYSLAYSLPFTTTFSCSVPTFVGFWGLVCFAPAYNSNVSVSKMDPRNAFSPVLIEPIYSFGNSGNELSRVLNNTAPTVRNSAYRANVPKVSPAVFPLPAEPSTYFCTSSYLDRLALIHSRARQLQQQQQIATPGGSQEKDDKSLLQREPILNSFPATGVRFAPTS